MATPPFCIPVTSCKTAELVFAALDQHTVVIVGAGAAGVVLPRLAEQLLALRWQRDEIACQIEALGEVHTLYDILT